MIKAVIKEIEYYLPEKVVANTNVRLAKKTGINNLHIAGDNETASDLAFNAAEKLLKKHDKKAVDFVIFCTQSPDYYLPTTACVLQNRLGLSKSCGALDYNLGCSGYIYGLSMAKGLIETDQAKNVLLLTGETYSKYINNADNAVKPLFGDAGTATLITGVESEKDYIGYFVFGTDGAGSDNLIVPIGGSRNHFESTDVVITEDDFGNKRTNRNLYMNGSAISEFALDVVPTTVNDILQKAGISKADVDYYVFHQANKFILKYLRDKCELNETRYWNNVSEYGNTVSNSIPIALKDMLDAGEIDMGDRLMLLGFGVGLSWAGCLVEL